MLLLLEDAVGTSVRISIRWWDSAVGAIGDVGDNEGVDRRQVGVVASCTHLPLVPDASQAAELMVCG